MGQSKRSSDRSLRLRHPAPTRLVAHERGWTSPSSSVQLQDGDGRALGKSLSILGSSTQAGQAEPEQVPRWWRIILSRASRQPPSIASSTYRGVMLHRVADVEHFSCLGVHGAPGSLLPRESWGRGGGRGGVVGGRKESGSGAGRAAPGMLRWPPVCRRLLAFLLFSSPLVLSTRCIQQQNGAHPFCPS